MRAAKQLKFLSSNESQNPWLFSKVKTSNFRHLLPYRRNAAALEDTKIVSVDHRIKWWNVVPGDQVRVIGDNDEKVRDVNLVNKLTNRVYLKRDQNVRCKFVLHEIC